MAEHVHRWRVDPDRPAEEQCLAEHCPGGEPPGWTEDRAPWEALLGCTVALRTPGHSTDTGWLVDHGPHWIVLWHELDMAHRHPRTADTRVVLLDDPSCLPVGLRVVSPLTHVVARPDHREHARG